MKNVTKKAGISTAVATALTVSAPAAMAADAFTLDTTAVVAAAAVILGAVGVIGSAFMMIPAAIKGWGVVKAIIFRS
ncbi:hypothetical protein LVJ82_17720 [Vitreoscilla massiliensis]|uniref:Phage coat protein n=1 Tax=Vitreoscilla massiliensis TaxID=1689272 RepID=A0ABY4E1N6_9NEIS|nr:hypothetical protein [Vitreoscilla massiliensis]UOO89256.1 hypothetical protein LVJ82_17720 [Vitreoscilla massiliensis]